MIPLFDLHCDTPRYIYDLNLKLADSNGHISLKKAEAFSPYIQVAAIWCTFESEEKALATFGGTIDKFDAECAENGCDIILGGAELKESVKKQKSGCNTPAFIYCIEDCGFITDENILAEVYERGVRILIPMWGKTNALGSSHEASGGLTPLGKRILTAAAKMGMILDISHASVDSATDIMDIAEKTGCAVIASHSNSRSFFDHTRNLNSYQIKRLVSLGGIIGHSLCPWHLADHGNADANTVISNIEALISEAGEDNVCFGCDLDGTDLPDGFNGLTSLAGYYELLNKRFSQEIADKLYFNNAYRKLTQFLK